MDTVNFGLSTIGYLSHAAGTTFLNGMIGKISLPAAAFIKGYAPVAAGVALVVNTLFEVYDNSVIIQSKDELKKLANWNFSRIVTPFLLGAVLLNGGIYIKGALGVVAAVAMAYQWSKAADIRVSGYEMFSVLAFIAHMVCSASSYTSSATPVTLLIVVVAAVIKNFMYNSTAVDRISIG